MFGRCRFLVTCEHASPSIPPEWRGQLETYCAASDTHRVWDPGAPEIAAHLAKLLHAPLLIGEHTRLLVDLNRTVGHPELFAPVLRELPETRQTAILTRHYYPFRYRAIRQLEQWLAEKRPVVHLSVHSFTPVLDGETRAAGFGLLFDPSHPPERALATVWLHCLKTAMPEIVTRENEPYPGVADGHCTSLRRCYGMALPYLGFELEFNQALPLAENAGLYAQWIFRTLKQSLQSKRVQPLTR